MKHFVLTIFLLQALVQYMYGQTNSHSIDTVNIYMNKIGVPYYIYKREWFFKAGSYSYNPNRMNKQDSLVMEDTLSYYFKVFDRCNKLVFSGKKREDGSNELEGDVVFYYPNGHIKRIERWDNKQENDSCDNLVIGINDGPGPEGSWKYFRRNGTLKKQLNYIIRISTCEPLIYTIIIQTIKFNYKGDIVSIQEKKSK